MELNLPAFDIQIRLNPKGRPQVYDTLRHKFVALTPEEWVRQHFVNYLVRHLCYPQGFMANEVALKHNGHTRRCDTVIYDRHASPVAIVEYKAPSVSLTPAVFDQIVRYNMVLDVDWLVVSNGLKHYCCRVDPQRRTYAFVRQIPAYDVIAGAEPSDGGQQR